MTEQRRVLLRPWRLGDAAAALTIWGDRRTLTYLDEDDFIGTLEEAQRTLKAAMDRHGGRRFCRLAAVEAESGRVFAGCGFHPYDAESLEIVYHLAPWSWGRGYATEIVALLLDYAAEHLEFERLVAVVHVGNKASQRVLEKSGFQQVGEELEYGDPIYELRQGIGM